MNQHDKQLTWSSETYFMEKIDEYPYLFVIDIFAEYQAFFLLEYKDF